MLFFSFTAIAQEKKTDRETDKLKGLVKIVFTERTDVTMKSNKMIESKTRPESEVTYNEKGERLNYKNYDYRNGLLFEDTIYDFIDGERVSIEKDVSNPNKITGTIVGEVKPKKEFDPRYDYKFKYKYDKNGNVTEESWYHSDGSLWMRYVYIYKDKQREELVYAEDGSLNQKYRYTLDDKDNDIEMLSFDTETNKINGKETYEYQKFDVKGNWTKKIIYENEEDNLKRMKTREVHYRKLVYFQ